MDRRKRLMQAVVRAKRSLNGEKLFGNVQQALLFALLSGVTILLVSRLFVFPYYMHVAISLSVLVFLVVILVGWWKRVHGTEAMHALDQYFSHNELVTALTIKDNDNPLVQSLVLKAEEETEQALKTFRHRQKKLWLPKVLIGIGFSAVALGLLFVFPAATQQEAKVVEQERVIISDLKEEVAELEKKATTKETKKELQELQKKLEDVKTSEEALREVVKKQKELKLQEQKLKDKAQLAENSDGEQAEGLTAEETEQLKELAKMNSSLANQSVATQSALSKLGKPVSFSLQNAIASDAGEQNDEGQQGDGASEGEDGEGQGSAQGEGDGQNPGEGSTESPNSGEGDGTGEGQGTGQGAGTGQGEGAGTGGGQGTGTGTGTGAGGGTSQGGGNGSGAGLSTGNRNLSVPSRIGGTGDTTVDGGELGEGTPSSVQQGPVPVTKGTIRPYEEIVGDYKDSYLQSTDRLQLPKDLQQMVQSYFSSIEE